MKLFQRLLVAPAALGLMAPLAANADISAVSNDSNLRNALKNHAEGATRDELMGGNQMCYAKWSVGHQSNRFAGRIPHAQQAALADQRVQRAKTPAATATPRGSVHEKSPPFEKEGMFAESASSC